MPGTGFLRKPVPFDGKKDVMSHKRYNVLDPRVYNV
jgi:hypothetical protein